MTSVGRLAPHNAPLKLPATVVERIPMMLVRKEMFVMVIPCPRQPKYAITLIVLQLLRMARIAKQLGIACVENKRLNPLKFVLAIMVIILRRSAMMKVKLRLAPAATAVISH